MEFLFTVGLCVGTIICGIEWDKHKRQYVIILCRCDGMADMTDSKSVAAKRAGSSPATCTKARLMLAFS